MKKIFLAAMFSSIFTMSASAGAGGGGGGGPKSCGNGICGSGETPSNCPQDCCLVCNCADPICRNNCVNDCNVPIDGGIGILFALGLAYGTKKVYDSKRKSNTPV